MSPRARTISIVLAIVAIGGVLWWKCRGASERPPVDAAITVPMTKARLKLRDLARQQPGTVRGKVSADGKPIAGALVCRRPSDDLDDIQCVATEATGSYLFVELRPGAYQLWASAVGFSGVRYSDKLVLKAGESKSGIDLVLGRGSHELAGRVRDTRGRVLGGAMVHVRVDGEPIATTRTAADGGFRARVDGNTATVEATAEGYVDASTQTVAPASGIELVLLPEATLSGIVVETGTRTPIADARVWLEGSRVTSADDGTFRATKLRPGRYKPTASSIGGYGEATESVLLRVGAHVEGVVIEVGDEADTHVEIVRDLEKGKFTLYLLKEDRKTPVAIKDLPKINLKTKDGKKQIEMKAVEPKEEKASQFEAEDEALRLWKLEGRIALVLGDGKSYQVALEHDHEGHEHGGEKD